MKNSKPYFLILRQLRLNKNLTQKELSLKLGEPQSYISKYESGEQRLDFLEIEKICLALNISLLDFIRIYSETKPSV